MNALFAAAIEIERFCRDRQWRFCVIGGLAVQRWGEPRQTRDVDLTILTGIGDEPAVIDPLLREFEGRLAGARQFALDHRVLLLRTRSGVPLDVSLGALDVEARIVARASPFLLGDAGTITTCSAEDLIVLKAFADRPQDWLDIEGIIARQGPSLDRPAVLAELTPLLDLKEDMAPLSRLASLFDKHPA